MTAWEMWLEIGMGELRDEAVADVRKRFQAGTLSWMDVGSLIGPFPANGELDTLVEGHSDEDHVNGDEAGQPPWKTSGPGHSDEEDMEGGD
eukprot:15476537-Alexandrium_andersonii.AAC.1